MHEFHHEKATKMLHTYSLMLERLHYDLKVQYPDLLARASRLVNHSAIRMCQRDMDTLRIKAMELGGRIVDAVALQGLIHLHQLCSDSLACELVEFHLTDLLHRSARAIVWAGSSSQLSPEGIQRASENWRDQARSPQLWALDLEVNWSEKVASCMATHEWYDGYEASKFFTFQSFLGGLNIEPIQEALKGSESLENAQNALQLVMSVLQHALDFVGAATEIDDLTCSHATAIHHSIQSILLAHQYSAPAQGDELLG